MITSPANERIKAARKLHSKQHRRTNGKILIEGVRLIDDALQSGAVPELVFFSPDATEKNQDVARLLAVMEGLSVQCTPVSVQVMASLAETITPQGLVVVVALPETPAPMSPSLVLILDGVRDPGNAGTLLRSAEAAGADLVIFGPGAVDAFNDKVVRAGMGVHFRLAMRTIPDWEQVWSSVGALPHIYVAEADAALEYDAVDWRQPAALIVGSEASGPSDTALALATGVSIPMAGCAESLNAAMAGTILLFEAARQRRHG